MKQADEKLLQQLDGAGDWWYMSDDPTRQAFIRQWLRHIKYGYRPHDAKALCYLAQHQRVVEIPKAHSHAVMFWLEAGDLERSALCDTVMAESRPSQQGST